MASAAAPLPAGHARTRLTRPASGRLRTSWPVILAVFICFVSHALAAALDAALPTEAPAVYDRLIRRGGRGWVASSAHDAQRRRIQKRQESNESEEVAEEDESTTTSTDIPVTTTFSIALGTPKPSTTSTIASASPLPSILDSIPAGFTTTSCPVFINSFLTNATFKQCYPLSMLFEKSRSFFEAKRSLVSITRTLDATCAPNATFCNEYLQSLAADLVAPQNCGPDYEIGHAAIVGAYDAMRAYAPVYSAGCLRDPDTSAYCYANAVTNLTNPSSAYVYFLPLNRTLPGSTVPTCDYCLQQTMAIFQAATADRRQLIANTYKAAARQVNTICGPAFVNESLAEVVVPSSAAGGLLRGMQASTWLAVAVPLLVAVLGVV